MEIKQVQLIPKGMNQDLSISKFNPEFSYENRNIRVTAREGDTLLTISNEKGNIPVNLTFQGKCIGYSILNEYLVLFTTTGTLDYIYRLKDISTESPVQLILYEGDLKFSINHPIETIAVYETNLVQKVYWTDGLNQPRVINIVGKPEEWVGNKYAFDFAPGMDLKESVTITPQLTGGFFSAGVIQYAFSNFNAFGAETGIFHVTDLYYISTVGRALSPEQTSSNSFRILINNLDSKFEYTRIYSIQRTSLNTIPIVKIIGDYKRQGVSPIEVVDTGRIGYEVDPNLLLYLGAEELILGTITSKDNTLFGGNITLARTSQLSKVIDGSTLHNSFSWSYRDQGVRIEDLVDSFSGLYTYNLTSLNRNRGALAHFKRGQYYRFGIQAQHITGKWSEPLWIGADKKCDLPFLTEVKEDDKEIVGHLNQGTLVLNGSIIAALRAKGYRRVRPIFVYPDIADRTVIAQGIVTNTLAFNHLRDSNSPFAFTDYAYRPSWFGKSPLFTNAPFIGALEQSVPGFLNTGHLLFAMTEIDGTMTSYQAGTIYASKRVEPVVTNARPYECFIDENLVNVISPDIQYNENFESLLTNDIYCQFIGIAHVGSCYGMASYQRDNFTVNEKVSRRNNFDEFTIGMPPLNTGGEQATRTLFVQNPFSATSDISVAYNKMSSKIYTLFNTIFNDTSNLDFFLKYDINKPIYCNYNDDTTIIPYTTNTIDRGGVINYGKGIDENLIFTPEGGLTTTRLYYKAGSHVTFSYKDNKDLDLSVVTPSFRLGDSFIDPVTPAPPISNIEDKVIVNSSLGWEPNQTDFIEGNFVATFSLAISIIQIDNMEDLDTVSIQPRVLIKKQGEGDIIYDIVNAGPEVVLTKADYNALEDYDVGGFIYADYKRVSIEGIILGTAPTVAGDGSWITSFNDIIYFQKENPIITTNPSTKFVVNGIIEGTLDPDIPVYSSSDVTIYDRTPYYRDSLIGYGYIKQILNVNSFKYINSKNGLAKNYVHFPLVELRRDIDPTNLYGGQTSEALLSNMWLPCGNTVYLHANSPSVTISYTRGDTYIRRYDHLKTVPGSEEEVNKMLTSLSFLCETFINLDGRYDRNRYNLDLGAMRYTNYGLLNHVYSQQDNFFNYRILDERLFESDTFSNKLIWSGVKSNGELVDKWTNINLISTADLEGNLGGIVALKNFNSTLLAFQDKGIATILFNSRVQIPTSDGVPIEIANSLKFEGFRYITNQVGCSNKFSIVTTKNGLYFIDSINKSINKLSEGIEDLSLTKGFKSWSTNNISSQFIAHSDNVNNDIYISSPTTCLGFSEIIDYFTSFYDYEDVPFMFNFDKEFCAIKNIGNNAVLYLQNKGVHNSFFGQMKPSSIEYKLSPEPMRDKTFNNIEYRADCFDMNDSGHLLDFETFDTLRVWNEYQDSGDFYLIPEENIFKKFRVWRMPLPRHAGSLDRIRNTWANLKISFTPSQGDDIKLLMHDIVLNYTI